MYRMAARKDLGNWESIRPIFDGVLELYNGSLARSWQAVAHLLRLHRIIRLTRGMALLIGVGGSACIPKSRIGAEVIRDNLHLVLAMSPAGSQLRTRCRNFPGMVAGCTIESRRLGGGLDKLVQAAVQVLFSDELEEKKAIVDENAIKVRDLIDDINMKTEAVTKRKEEASAAAEQIEKDSVIIEKEKAGEAGYGLLQWVLAMVKYYEVAKGVAPKRELVNKLQRQKEEAEEHLSYSWEAAEKWLRALVGLGSERKRWTEDLQKMGEVKKRRRRMAWHGMNLREKMTQTMYDYTCMGVFEKHKLLFSFQMTSMILDGDNDLDKREFDFYMKGNPSLDRPKEPSPHAWLSETGWKDWG
eukprot:Skav217002  [mRNA]  locus=scaffold1803:60421:72656:+ [translate_table: standard]